MWHTQGQEWPSKPSNNRTCIEQDTPLQMTEKKSGAHHCCFAQCHWDERCPEKYIIWIISFYLFPKPKWRLGDCKNLDQSIWSTPWSDFRSAHKVCLCQDKGSGANAAQMRSRKVYSKTRHTFPQQLSTVVVALTGLVAQSKKASWNQFIRSYYTIIF